MINIVYHPFTNIYRFSWAACYCWIRWSYASDPENIDCQRRERWYDDNDDNYDIDDNEDDGNTYIILTNIWPLVYG